MSGGPRRAGSPAELEAREAARAAKLDALHATLTKQIAALSTGQDWQRWLTVAARFHSYSVNNVLLICAQRPDATAVAGYQAWKALGRQVNLGERGIQILAPVVRRAAQPDQRDAEAADVPQTTDQAPNQRTGGVEIAGARRVAGFRVVHVFDVTQTSGAPLPERPVPQLLAGQAPAGLWEALDEQVHARGFTLDRGPCLGGLANGLTNYLTRTVTVRADVDAAQAVKTLTHELAHVLLHDPTAPSTAGPGAGDPDGLCRGRTEVEAESVAFLVTANHGLDSSGYTFPYVAGWAGAVDAVTPEAVVRETAQRVLSAAHLILTATEHQHTQDGLASDLAQAQAQEQAVDHRLGTTAAQLHARAENGAQDTAALRDTASITEQATVRHATGTPMAAPAPPRTGGTRLSPPGTKAGPGRERLLEVHELATAFYRARLSAPGGEAQRGTGLLARRGVDAATAAAAGLGYAPPAWTQLIEHLRGAGVTDDELLASGLALPTSRGTLVDRFRDRLVFPVRDGTGHTIGLLGRAVDPAGTDRSGSPVPKYLNGPDTALYRKGAVLYGLDDKAQAALAAGALPVLVEGPLDVLAVNLAGTHHPGPDGAPSFVAVASCGTAVTIEQVALLDAAVGGLAQHGVVVAFDGDAAGRRAAVRAYELLRAVDAWPHALDLPAEQDPAGLLQQHGPAALHAALGAAAARPLADLVVDERLNRYAGQLQWAEGQLAAGRAAAAVVATLPSEQVVRQIVRLAARLDMPASEVGDLVVDAITSPRRSALPSPRAAGSPRVADRQPPTGATATPATGRAAAGPPSAAQRARAGFPVPLTPQLRPPVAAPPDAGLGTAPSARVAARPPPR